MTRIDWIVMRRLSGRIGLTLAVFFGIFALVQSLDTWRFAALTKMGGPPLAILAIIASTIRPMIDTLPVTVLIGTIIGVLDLQARREMTVIRSTGTSIWVVMRAPLLAAVGVGLVVGLLGDGLAIQLNRSLPVVNRSNSSSGQFWIEQTGADGPFKLVAEHVRREGRRLDDVTLFFTEPPNHIRIEASAADLKAGAWVLSDAIRYQPDGPPVPLGTFQVATTTTAGEMRVILTSAHDLTFSELLTTMSQNVVDPHLRSATTASLLRLLAIPGLLAGSVLIGFAFTSGYRRTNKYGGAVLYGVVLGFVVYVVTDLANRSGFSGIIDPAFAAFVPAFVAIVIGLTVLLFKEDGRA